ncbi:pyridoxamine 5'-phosphate oxidase family protein [Priestia megaterium]|jgi:hypothetical protein|uniref:pyridoxamine 5'-phosphate oxidase family protein n=1 Tax=Priestia megaterium TaxID=1404 RepID=UPI002A6A9651|nr:pyridoxamine 5'-phosphate oxidase family protein [Priestia megaterium]MDY0941339.1 pyridoxamine 5'-phosphate oxidase family protein [Priestia megaterium]
MNKTELPKAVRSFLNGKGLERKQHDAMLLSTVTSEGFPHVAMISAGELVAISSSRVKLLIWKDTTSSKNMIQNHKATVTLVMEGKAYYIKLLLKKEASVLSGYELFTGEVAAFKEDYAKYAVLTSGIQFQLHHPKEVLSRWEKSIEAVLSTEKTDS